MDSEIEVNECRTFEQVDDVLNLAKLKQEELTPFTNSLYFSKSDLYNHNYKFLQLDDYLLHEIREGQTLSFKGDQDENVVLCSKTKTYDINEAETSNSLLLVDGLHFFEDCRKCNDRQIGKVNVKGIFYNYLEPVPGKPYFQKLEKILNETIYRGQEHEFSVDKNKLYTFEEFDQIIQSSTKELKEELDKLDVILIDDKVRLLDLEYHFRVLSCMLKLIEENSWNFNEINYEVTLDSLKDIFPRDVVHCLFEKYTDEADIIDATQLYRYNEQKICKFFARVLLSQAGKFSLDEFLQAWMESVPEGMCPDESMLYGIAIIDRNTIPHGIWAFCESTLPENINERFKVLFETKEKWTVAEITPYIRKLATEKMDVNALLAKFARSSTVDGIKYYCSKHHK